MVQTFAATMLGKNENGILKLHGHDYYTETDHENTFFFIKMLMTSMATAQCTSIILHILFVKNNVHNMHA